MATTAQRLKISIIDQVFITDQGVCFVSKFRLDEAMLKVATKEYQHVPVDLEWYVDSSEYRTLNRELPL